jgi:hypothetical protein
MDIMKQFITTQSLFIQGNADEVIEQLKKLSNQFETLKELLDFYSNNPK